jgi:hypothetical protein
VTITLQKVKGDYSFEHWNELRAKKGGAGAAAPDTKKDPTAGIMDMMKDMYDGGDDQMKKVGETRLRETRMRDRRVPVSPGERPQRRHPAPDTRVTHPAPPADASTAYHQTGLSSTVSCSGEGAHQPLTGRNAGFLFSSSALLLFNPPLHAQTIGEAMMKSQQQKGGAGGMDSMDAPGAGAGMDSMGMGV